MNKAIFLLPALLLASCGDPKPEKAPDVAAVAEKAAAPAPEKAPEPTPGAPLTPEAIKELSVSIETAMSEIPPELRNEFQKAFVCYNKAAEAKSKAEKTPVPTITGDTIRQITASLKAAGGVAAAC